MSCPTGIFPDMLTLIRPDMNDDTMITNTSDNTECLKYTDQVSGTLKCQGGEGGDYHSEIYTRRPEIQHIISITHD